MASGDLLEKVHTSIEPYLMFPMVLTFHCEALSNKLASPSVRHLALEDLHVLSPHRNSFVQRHLELRLGRGSR
jgi:hypothetical protein